MQAALDIVVTFAVWRTLGWFPLEESVPQPDIISFLFSWTAPAPTGRHMGDMLLLKTTSVDSVMIATSFTKVLGS